MKNKAARKKAHAHVAGALRRWKALMAEKTQLEAMQIELASAQAQVEFARDSRDDVEAVLTGLKAELAASQAEVRLLQAALKESEAAEKTKKESEAAGKTPPLQLGPDQRRENGISEVTSSNGSAVCRHPDRDYLHTLQASPSASIALLGGEEGPSQPLQVRIESSAQKVPQNVLASSDDDDDDCVERSCLEGKVSAIIASRDSSSSDDEGKNTAPGDHHPRSWGKWQVSVSKMSANHPHREKMHVSFSPESLAPALAHRGSASPSTRAQSSPAEKQLSQECSSLKMGYRMGGSSGDLRSRPMPPSKSRSSSDAATPPHTARAGGRGEKAGEHTGTLTPDLSTLKRRLRLYD